MSHYETKIVSTPFDMPDVYGALNMPVYYSAAFELPSAQAMSDAFRGRSAAHSYGRISNPTTQYLERRVQAVTGAVSVTALNSGMAAIAYTLVALSGQGLNIVASKHLFGNTVALMRNTLSGYGVETRFADFCHPEEVERLIDDHTALLFFEIITNPQLFVADLNAISAIARRHGVPLVADTTIVPFPAFHAKDWDVDIELLSSTKYISGGATGIGGMIVDYGSYDYRRHPNSRLREMTGRVGPKLPFTARVKGELITNLGAIMAPQVAYMETLGMETLDLRFRRQASSALAVARECRDINGITAVNYPGLRDHEQYELSRRQYGELPGAVFTINLKSRDAAFAFIDRLKLIRRATNLFDHKSLAIHPASTIFGLFTDEERREMQIDDRLIRISVGLESPDDITADIRQAAETKE